MEPHHKTVRNAVKLLTLDGGDLRALSQLCLLEELMNRVNYGKPYPLLPCDYFDMIIGSGTGGVIAILLVVFRLSAEKAMKQYLEIYDSVWKDTVGSRATSGSNEHIISSKRTEQLKEAVYRLLESNRLPKDERLLDSYRNDSCLVIVCVASVLDVSVCRRLRNRRGNEAFCLEPTIVEAICASVAFPRMFEPVRFGPPRLEEEFISCKFYFNNPTKEGLQEARDIFELDRQVAAIVSLGCGRALPPPISSRMNETEYAELVEMVASDSEQVAEDMERQIGQSSHAHRRVYYRFSVDHIMDQTGEQRLHQKILSHTRAYISRERTNRSFDECVDACEAPGYATLEDLTHFREHSVRTHGLPPPPEFLVVREKEMQEMEVYLFRKCNRRAIVVVSGLPGSGKTQLVNKFVRDCLPKLPVAIWIDASSAISIRSSMIARVRELGRNPATLEDSLGMLARWDEKREGSWILIFDNADDQSIHLGDYFPSGDHGYIIVTTRDESRGSLSPSAHLKLSSMSRIEAIQTFINAAFIKRQISMAERREAERIVEALGYLPLAVHQAGCYVRQRNCLSEYTQRLRDSRRTVLAKSVHEQPDRYRLSVHQVFRVTVDSLPKPAQQFLFLFSSAHHTNLPRSLIRLAAAYHFRLDTCELVSRNEEQTPELVPLYEIFCPTGQWDEDIFDDLLETLQSASLITAIPSEKHIFFLYMHPLLHAWVNDELSPTEKTQYRAAAARLLSCGTGTQIPDLHEHLISHINALSKHWDEIHVNDRASFADLLAFPGIADDTVRIWESVYKELEDDYGEFSLPILQATGRLAWAYEMQGDEKRAEVMHIKENRLKEILASREEHKPLQDAELLQRSTDLQSIRPKNFESFLKAKVIEQMRDPIQVFSPELHLRLTRDQKMKFAAQSLANNYVEHGMHENAVVFGKELLHARAIDKGTPSSELIYAQEYLAGAYERQGKYDEAIPWRRSAYDLRRRRSEADSGTLQAIRHLSYDYGAVGRCSDAYGLIKYLLDQPNNTALYIGDVDRLANTCEAKGHVSCVRRFRSEIERLQGLSQNNTPTSATHRTQYSSDQNTGRPWDERPQRQYTSTQFEVRDNRTGDEATFEPELPRPSAYLAEHRSATAPLLTNTRASQQTVYIQVPTRPATVNPSMAASPDEDVSDAELAAAFERQGLMGRAAAIRRRMNSQKHGSDG